MASSAPAAIKHESTSPMERRRYNVWLLASAGGYSSVGVWDLGTKTRSLDECNSYEVLTF
jgi:hypothetical protein